MKNQYFGDMYDYIKYGLLRQLSDYGKVSIAVCWMLTENDDRRDGHRINYLEDTEAWRAFDPTVFDCLRTAVLDRKERNIKVLEDSQLLQNTSFYSHLVTDGPEERGKYFDGFLEFARGRDLVFFDPDNGLEIKSVKYGRKGASRYIYMQEVSKSFTAGHSVFVYQHMPPKPRDPFINDLANSLIQETGAESAYVFYTRRVAFFLLPQINKVDRFAEVASRVQTKWGDQLSIRRYTARNDTTATKSLPTMRA